MKRFFITLSLMIAVAVSAFSADMSQVWSDIKQTKGFFVDEVSASKTQANGFQNLLTAINTAPTSADIRALKNLTATIDSKQKITTVSQSGVNISVYCAPASADGKLFKLMFVIDKDDNEDKMLAVLYGTCTQEGMLKALQNMSIVDIIGG